MRGAADIDLQVKTISEKHHVSRYLQVSRVVREEYLYKQTRRGRPGPDTAYRKVTRRRFDIEWITDEETIAYDHRSDGMYPLITNDRGLSPAQVLEAHKRQPMIEKRFEQIKTVHEIAPVFLKNEARIEALFTLYFLALLVQALIERELRLAMKREKIRQLPLYPEQRLCAHPSTEQVLHLFSLAMRNKPDPRQQNHTNVRRRVHGSAASGARTAWCFGKRVHVMKKPQSIIPGKLSIRSAESKASIRGKWH